MKAPEVSISVNGQDCGDSARNGVVRAEELEAIAECFLEGAKAIRERRHGAIDCENNLANIGVDCGGPFDDDKGLPVLKLIRIKKSKKRT